MPSVLFILCKELMDLYFESRAFRQGEYTSLPYHQSYFPGRHVKYFDENGKLIKYYANPGWAFDRLTNENILEGRMLDIITFINTYYRHDDFTEAMRHV